MEHHGIHILAELSECENLAEYDNSKKLAALLRKAAIAAKCQVIKINVHKFEPHGISGLVFLAESHLSIHTWPEDKYVAVDFYACGEAEPRLGIDVLIKALGAKNSFIESCARGIKIETMFVNKTLFTDIIVYD
jgi:S-adenosylmethionine decarboxylase proenzyme